MRSVVDVSIFVVAAPCHPLLVINLICPHPEMYQGIPVTVLHRYFAQNNEGFWQGALKTKNQGQIP